VVALGAAAGLLSFASPAEAVLPPPQTMVASGGSDTTDKFMAAYMPTVDNTTVNGHVVRTVSVRSQPNPNQVVQGDVHCNVDIQWKTGPGGSNGFGPLGAAVQDAPNGSTAGRNYLFQQGTQPANLQGCIDTARSSSSRRPIGQDRATFEYYSFALDAVNWATPSMKAPGQLTQTQLVQIYDCVITDWGQVGGTPGPIQRYLPQTGSGTRDFFVGQVLGKSTSYTFPSNGSCPPVKASVLDPLGNTIPFEENQGKTIEPADIDKAILPYSGGVWSNHFANRLNPTLDLRNGVRQGGLTMDTAPNTKGLIVEWSTLDETYQLNTSPGGVVTEANTVEVTPVAANRYPGIRYVHNVVDSGLPGYLEARGIVGFDNVASGAKSKLCTSGPTGSRSLIVTFGFAPLNTSEPVPGSNLAGATCRFWAPV
jgi:ABC-type phosphate transport system substrate-binding protein